MAPSGLADVDLPGGGVGVLGRVTPPRRLNRHEGEAVSCRAARWPPAGAAAPRSCPHPSCMPAPHLPGPFLRQAAHGLTRRPGLTARTPQNPNASATTSPACPFTGAKSPVSCLSLGHSRQVCTVGSGNRHRNRTPWACGYRQEGEGGVRPLPEAQMWGFSSWHHL